MFFTRFYKLRIKTFYLNIKHLICDLISGEMLYYAASLSFYTIFALIPILLILITIMANLPSFEIYLISIQSELMDKLMPAKSEALVAYIDTILQNGLHIGLLGSFYILLTSILFFNNYEFIVSKIFNEAPKSFVKAFSTYLTLMLFTPIILALITFMAAEASNTLRFAFEFFNLSFRAFTSFLMSWVLFVILMKASINFKVPLKGILRSAFFTAFIWYLAQKLFISYIFANTTYQSLYGSFSSILFFFLWIYVSWIIYLYGLKSAASMRGVSKTHKA